MKKTLSLLLVLAMVLSSFSFAFAAEAEKTPGEVLKDLGVLTGNAKGDLMLEDELSRQDMIVLLSRVLGQEDEAKAFKGEMSFTDVNDSFYKPYVAWAEANKLTNGVGEGKFGFGRAVTEQEVAQFMLRALNYTDVEFKDVPAKAVELGLVAKDADLTVNCKRARMAEITLAALGTKMNGSEKTLAENLGIEMPVPAGATKVETVYADNLKEIVVEFDGPVEKTSATTITNYKLDGSTLTRVSKAVLSEDGKTVTIQLRNGETLKNQRNYKLAISGIKSANEKTILNETKEFKPLDVKVPEVTNVEALGNRLVKVTFSEPVKKDTAERRANYKLNGYVANGNLTLSADLKSVSIKLASAMKSGENKLTISDVEDYAGMKIINVYDRAFEVVEDKTAPESFEVTDATLEYVEIEFNEAIDPDTAKATNVYWLDTNGRKVVAKDVYNLDSNYLAYGIEFSQANKLPARETTLFVEKVKDFSGNTAAKLSASVTAKVDTDRPELKSIDFAKDVNNDEYLGTNKLDLTFNKSVDLSTLKGANRYNVTVKNENGKIVAVAKNAEVKDYRYFPTTVVVELSSSLTEGKTYTVEVKNVVDTTYLKNMMIPVIETVTVPNISNPKVYNAYKSTDALKIHVVFDKEMAMGGEGSVLDLNKYMIKVGDEWQLLPKNTEIEPGYDNKSVIIKFEKATNATAIKVTLVEDAFGNKIAGLTQEEPLTNPDESKVVKVELVDKNRVAVTFDKQLIYADPASFDVKNAGKDVKSSVSYTVNSKGQGVVNIDLNDDVYTDKDLTLVVTAAKSEDVVGLGIKPDTFSAANIADKVAPVVKLNKDLEPVASAVYGTVAPDTDYLQSVEIEYVEGLKVLDGVTAETAANDFVIYADYDNVYRQLTAGVDYTVSTNADKAVITFTTVSEAKEISIKTADTTKYVVDMSGNSIEEVEVNFDLTSKKGIGPKAAANKAAEDQKAAKPVADKINALPKADEITAENLAAKKVEVEAARTAYNGLTADQKKLVDITKLTAAEAKIAELETPVGPTIKAVYTETSTVPFSMGTVTVEVKGLDGAAQFEVIYGEEMKTLMKNIGEASTAFAKPDDGKVTINIYAKDGTTLLKEFKDVELQVIPVK